MACRRSRWVEVDQDGELGSLEEGSDDEGMDEAAVCVPWEPRAAPSGLRWSYSDLERIVLMLGERFGFRIEMAAGSSLVRRGGAMALVPAGLAIAGGILGGHFGGRAAATIGSAIGGAIGVGVVMVSLSDVWDTIKSLVPELLDLVFDYLGGLGVQDYRMAIEFLISMDGAHAENLALIILHVVREVLGKNVISTLPSAH